MTDAMPNDLANADASQRLHTFFGVSPSVQKKVGTFILIWGKFECTIELLIWSTKGETPAGVRPSTDARPVSVLIDNLRTWAKSTADDPLLTALVLTCEIADNLLEYRNAVVHGRIFEGGKFTSNGSLLGELRKRQETTVHVSEGVLDRAIRAADVLERATGLISAVYAGALDDDHPVFNEILGRLLTTTRESIEVRYLSKSIVEGTYG